MGLRFRKSIKLAPGVKLNLNKKSTGITVGGKGAHYTINSNGKKTASVGIPGTGISYSTSTGGGTSKSKNSRLSQTNTSAGISNNSGCGGCLLVFFGICLVLAVLAFILTYAWIPGIIAIIYFAKKTQDPKQCKIRVGISVAVTILSFIAFLSSLFQPELTSLTVNWDTQKYDISEEVVLELVVQEEGADIYSLEISDNDIATVDYSNDIATVHFVSEGTSDISFTANDEIESNVTTITVTDREAEEQRRLEAEEEKARKEAEEDAKKDAEKKAEAERQESQEPMVWIPSSGSKYHSRAGCSNMENPTEVPVSEAKARGYEPCGRCY